MAEAKRRTIGEMSTDARVLYNVIVKGFTKDGRDFLGYPELSAVIGGRDVQKEARGLLQTARRG
jgi:hypothetical protein